MTVTFLQGDVREVLPTLPADHFDCVVTSPPYWSLRDYGVAGQIGLEPTLNEYLDTMVGICSEVHRVLKPEGTFWLNIGDSYARSGGSTDSTAETRNRELRHMTTAQRRNCSQPIGMKSKDLCMVPNRLAIRLQEAGWYVRSEIIWHKPNPMPESVRDRPTNSHEKVWLLTKSERYWYDQNAVREPLAASSVARLSQDVEGQIGSDRANGGGKTNWTMKAVRFGGNKGGGDHGSSSRLKSGNEWQPDASGANIRNVWTVATVPFKDAHFAVMAPELAGRCIKAGCPVGGRVLDPFGGAGTTGLVADRLQRHATLIELNQEYLNIAQRRIETDAPLLAVGEAS